MSLAALADAIGRCRRCRDAPDGAPLPHEPRPVLVASSTARILIAGQAPGTRVHVTGIPFNDPSGDRLRQWLGVGREAFYDPARFAIVPMGFCFPGLDARGADLPPRKECAPEWRGPLLALMPQVELVLAIGAHAQRHHLGPDCRATLSATVEAWREILHRPVRPHVLPLPHPSWRNSGWLRHHPWFERDVLPVLRDLVVAHGGATSENDFPENAGG